MIVGGMLLVATSCGYAQTIYFHIDQSAVDSIYLGNNKSLRQLHTLLSSHALASRIDSLYILSYASPDGNRSYNERLARKRSLSVHEYLLRNYPSLDRNRIRLRPQGENWQELRQLIESDMEVPCREEVLQIIDLTPDTERCKYLLKKLNGGTPYRYIREHILDYLRRASVCMVRMKPVALDSAVSCWAERMASIPVRVMAERNFLQRPVPPVRGSISVGSYVKRPVLALKTNLLFDLAMAPNIELEIPLGKHWSVSAEWMFPWWMFKNDKYCFEVLSGGLEGRYWPGNRKKCRALTGHFFGFYAGGGLYDLQWDRDGYQGEFYIASGISYGYALPIGRNLNLEFSIGIGLLRTDYEHYHTLDNYQTLLWQDSGRYTWIGPTKAKISFVWLLNRKVKSMQKGGVR